MTIERSTDPDGLAAAVVSLADALGVVTRLTLDVEPTVSDARLFEDLPVAAFRDHFDEITSARRQRGSGFTQWRGPVIEQIWTKQRVREGGGDGSGCLRSATCSARPPRPSSSTRSAA